MPDTHLFIAIHALYISFRYSNEWHHNKDCTGTQPHDGSLADVSKQVAYLDGLYSPETKEVHFHL